LLLLLLLLLLHCQPPISILAHSRSLLLPDRVTPDIHPERLLRCPVLGCRASGQPLAEAPCEGKPQGLLTGGRVEASVEKLRVENGEMGAPAVVVTARLWP